MDNSCAVKVDTPPLVSSLLQVVARDGGKCRLMIDLRYVIQYLHKFKFKYEGLDVAAQLLENYIWMTMFDLQSGYHHYYRYSPCLPAVPRFLMEERWREMLLCF